MCQNVIMGAADLFTHDLGVFCMPKLSRCENTFAQAGTLVAEMYAALCWKFCTAFLSPACLSAQQGSSLKFW